MKDQKSDLKTYVALTPRAAIASDTTTAGAIIDRLGFDAVTFSIISGVLTDGAYAVLIEEGDDSGLSDAAAVADSDLIGTEALAGFAATDDGVAKTIGYIGVKRYVRLSIVSTSTSSGGFIAATAILGCPHNAPTS